MKQVKVAIAEDDFRIADIHERFLSEIPEVMVVGKALNASDTLRLLKQEKVDLLLLDVYMPDELGTNLLLTLHNEFPNVDVIMITAATEKHILEKSIRNGVFNYLIKPVTKERFVQVVKKYIQYKNLLDQKTEVDQEFVDSLFRKSQTSQKINTNNLPKGIDAITLEKVLSILTDATGGLSAEQVGERMGASRTTARRYLEFLISVNKCKAEVAYGVVGRPERHYFKI